MTTPHLIDLWASQRHYADHVRPIWEELTRRGVPARLLVPAGRDWHTDAGEEYAERVPPQLWEATGPILAAGYGDARSALAVSSRPVALWNHGSGQTFQGSHPSYSGGGDRSRIALFLEPGPHAAEATRRSLPAAAVVKCGPAKLDRYRNRPKPPTVDGRPVVALAWHWRCKVAPETQPAIDDWRGEVLRLHATGRYHLIGHGHPRAWAEYEPWYREHGIEPVRDFAEVLDRAHLLVQDGSSVGYEFAAVTGPVLCLNAGTYRRDVEHGLRFWDAPPGPLLWPGDDLVSAVERALAYPPEHRAIRNRGIARAYGDWDGDGAARAADALDALRIAGDPGPFEVTSPRGTATVTPEIWDLIADGVLIRQAGSVALVSRQEYGGRWAPQGWRRAQ